VVDVNDQSFTLPETAHDPGESLTFCVRPEDFTLGAAENRIRAPIVHTEFQGATTRLRLDWQGTELTAAVDEDGGETFELGTELEVGFDPEAVHIVE
jgi:thiamine transport system ATP-binding protein